ncbi:MAG: recombinase family protein [Ruthenibacterium sp.]
MAEKVVRVIHATIPLVSAQSHSGIKKRRVAGYARVSTEKEEQQNSYDAQMDYYTTYIQSNPEWIFVDVYSDEGITGTSIKKRDGFNQMIADALDGKIDLIITKSVSRFARNTVDSLTTVRKLKEKGVEVYFQKENIYTLDSKGELLITIMSSLAQEESRSISENTTWGQRKRFADGKMSLAYSTFLGYKKGAANGEMEIVEDEAVIVRRIYDAYLSGKTPYDIATKLTAEHIPTPGNKTQWRASTVTSILHNEKYRGDAILQKKFTIDFLSKTTKKNEGELPMYYIPQNHPAIIRPEVFEMVQEEFRRRQAAGGHAQSVSIFSGRILCGDCGGYYGRKVWHAGSKHASWHWQCNRKFTKREYCATPTLKEESIEKAFLSAINSMITRKREIKANYALCLDAITDDSALVAELENANRECNEMSTQINQLLTTGSKQKGDLSAINKRYEECLARHEALQQKRKTLSSQIGLLAAKKIQITAFLRELDKLDGPLTEFDPLIFQATINYIKVNADCTIVFVFRDGTEFSEPIQNGVRSYAKHKKGNDEEK